MKKFKTDIYLDGVTEEEILNTRDTDVSGYTFNPSLYRQLGVKNYLEHSIKLTNLVNKKPISLEVIGDDPQTIIKQAIKLSQLSTNVFVKLPITLTNGNLTTEIMSLLTKENVKLNITAVFTMNQVKEIVKVLSNTDSIISVFAGRLYDIGIDAKEKMKEIGNFIHNNSQCKLLWASPRMSYDYISASQINCDIITMSMPLYKKLNLLNKDPEIYSLETVKMFYNDANDAGYKF